MVVLLKNLLQKSLNRAKISTEVKLARVADYVEILFSELFQKGIKDGIVSLSLKEKTLIISVKSPLVGKELKLFEGEMKKRINKYFHKKMVEKIRVQWRPE